MRKTYVAAFLLVFLSGCSGYQLAGERKNITVESIAAKTFTVNFCGNAYMNQKEVEKYAMQRAAEVTLAKGYSHFAVLRKNDKSQMCMLNPSGSYSPAPSSRESYDFQPFMKPNVTLTIQCFSANEKMPEGTIDAQKFLAENFPGLKNLK